MNDKDYFVRLNSLLEELNLVRKDLISVIQRICGNNLFLEDIYFMSAANRGLFLIDGFKIMIKERNLVCAGILLRTLIDNCNRIYAPFIVDGRDKFIKDVLENININKMVDSSGKKLTDRHLVEELSQFNESIINVYQSSSGFVHLSNKAIFQSIELKGNGGFEFHAGVPLEKNNEPLIECCIAFIDYVRLLIKILDAVASSKARFDSINQINS